MASRATVVALIVGGLVLLTAVPPVSAVCANPHNITVVPACLLEENIETALGALNAQTDGKVVFVGVYDFRFHPENITIHSGTTIMFLWLDTSVFGNSNHDPRSSGSTGSVALDMLKPAPPAPAACFWNLNDQGHLLGAGGVAGFGDYYNLTLRYTQASGLVEKSAGIGTDNIPVVGAPPYAQPFTACPSGTASYTPAGAAVIPYHCGIHGTTGNPLGMRGTITVVP